MPSIWIFGYGSLVHRPGFPHARRVQGYIPGFKRVWHQGSTDHRGTPERPGRVVTLEENPDAITYGVAYELCGDEQQQLETLRYLEWREKQYDVRHLVDVYGDPTQDGFAPAPPPVSIAHLLTPTQPPLHPSASVPNVTQSTTTTTTTTTTSSTTDSTIGSGIANSVGMVSSISTPALQDAAPRAAGGAGLAADAIGAMTTASMSSADPLMSSDEVAAYAPPADWKSLSADVYLRPSITDAATISNSSNGHGSQAAETQTSTQEGVVPGTRLLLRNVLCYIASSDIERNANYAGPATLDSIAQQIANAHGPSGPNWEYVCKLAEAFRQMSLEDPELFELEAKVLALKRSEQQQQSSVLAASTLTS